MYSGHMALILRDKTEEPYRIPSLHMPDYASGIGTHIAAYIRLKHDFSLGVLRGWITKEGRRQGSFQDAFCSCM